MAKKRAYLIAQAVIWTLLAVLLAASAIGLYAEGMAIRRETGDLFYPIYTRERVAARLAPLAPLFIIALGMTAVGWALGIRDEGDKPARSAVIPQHPTAARPRAALVLRTALIILAAALIAAGVLNGGLEDVLTKANAICMECVGLG